MPLPQTMLFQVIRIHQTGEHKQNNIGQPVCGSHLIFKVGTKERKQRETEEKKSKIIEVSKKLFLTRGYHDVSMREIAKHAEYGHSVIYSLFQSKDEIYAYVYLECLETLQKLYEKNLNPNPDDFKKEYYKSVSILIDFYEKHRQQYKALFFFNPFLMNKINEEVRKQMASKASEASDQLRQLFQNGMERGFFKETDINQLQGFLWTGLNGYIMHIVQWGQEDNIELIRDLTQRHAQIYLEGIKK